MNHTMIANLGANSENCLHTLIPKSNIDNNIYADIVDQMLVLVTSKHEFVEQTQGTSLSLT